MVLEANTDEELRELIFKVDFAAVMYYDEKLEASRDTLKSFEQHSDEEQYGKITFVKVNAYKNPIAKKIIEKNINSFMSIYKNGFLLDSKSITSEPELKKVLNYLLNETEANNHLGSLGN